jgi:hypothetical protein
MVAIVCLKQGTTVDVESKSREEENKIYMMFLFWRCSSIGIISRKMRERQDGVRTVSLNCVGVPSKIFGTG